VKPAPFAYHAPQSVAEAVGLLSEFGDEGKVLAGGQSLIPLLALRLARFENLVDLRRVPGLVGIERDGGGVRIGAMTTHAAVQRSGVLASAVPLLPRAAALVGHLAIRNRGTIGGALAHADPAAEFPAVALALDAELEVVGPGGTRRVPARDFFVSTYVSALEPDEVLVAARFPAWAGDCGFAVREYARRHGDFAMAGVVCAVQVSGDRVARSSIALIGMGGTPVRAAAAEAVLTGSALGDVNPGEAARAAIERLEAADDMHVTAGQRTSMVRALVRHALDDAIAEATGHG
jgi:aerobic carbon-monoxide dehydrogenase medium subunit